MGHVTMWWEDGISPVLLEVVTTAQRALVLEAERRAASGGNLFCSLCEAEGEKLHDRGFVIDNEESGEIYCLRCNFEPTTIWSILARGDQREELDKDPRGKHAARAV